MQKNLVTINLLDNKGKKFVDKFLDWALAIGRLLVIVTETVALAAFLYRFSIDRRLVDLHDEIKKNQAIVSYFKTGEDTYRLMQQKLLVSREQSAISLNMVILFEDMIRLGGDQVQFIALAINRSSIEVSIKASNLETLSNFVQTMKRHPKVASVSLDKVENRTSTATVVVTLTAKLQEKGMQL